MVGDGDMSTMGSPDIPDVLELVRTWTPDMDIDEPIYMHLSVITDVVETPASEVAS